ncbi:MAG: hypothetical protein BJ554DRAFT_419, partial [Olpidium bornovanus]
STPLFWFYHPFFLASSCLRKPLPSTPPLDVEIERRTGSKSRLFEFVFEGE